MQTSSGILKQKAIQDKTDYETLIKTGISLEQAKKKAESLPDGEGSQVNHVVLEELRCQKSRNNEDFNMDDDMCGKSGLVKTGGCACASTLGSINLYSALPQVHPGR